MTTLTVLPNQSEWLMWMGVPPLLAQTALACTDPLPAGVAAYVAGVRYVFKPTDELFAEKPVGGFPLVLHGPAGTGKTIAAIRALAEIVSLRMPNVDPLYRYRRARHFRPAEGYWVDWPGVSELFRQDAGDDPAPEWPKIKAILDGGCYQDGRLFGGQILVLDDLSRERATEYNRDRLQYILRKRYQNGLVTIITTNTHPDDWVGAYGEVMANFLGRTSISVELTEVYR